MGESIPNNHPVRLLSRIVDSLNLTELIRTYKPGGTTPFHPRMLLKVVFYAYMNNIYSCRKIEDMMHWNIQYIWLSGNQHPSYCTINRFRSEHMKDCVNGLFVQVVKLLVDMGLVSLDVQYIDGTKIESAANKYTFVWRKTTERNKARLEERIRGVLAQIDEGIAQDNAANGESESLTDTIDSGRLQELIDKINEENAMRAKDSGEDSTRIVEREKAVRKLRKQQEKLREYEDRLGKLGNRNSYSKTDPDATFMRMKEDVQGNGQPKPGYNLQIGTENQYITSYALYSTPGDPTTLPSFLTLDMARLGRMPGEVCADAGYGSEENYKYMQDNGIDAYVKYNWFDREQHSPYRDAPFRIGNLRYDSEGDYYVCPNGQRMEHTAVRKKVSDNGYVSRIDVYTARNCGGCPLRDQCFEGSGNREIKVSHQLEQYKRKAREMLNSKRGLYLRSRRSVEPEPVFGQIKWNKQYRRFRHTGFAKVNMDFGILAMALNLQKLIRNVDAERIRAFTKTLCACFCLFLAHIRPYTPFFRSGETSARKIRQLSDQNLKAA
jgi:transposase